MQVNFQAINNIGFQGRRPRITPPVNVSKGLLIQKIEAGATLPNLAKWLGVTIHKVRALLGFYGLKTKEAQVIEKISQDELKGLIEKGLTQYEISKIYGVNGLTVTALLKKFKLVPSDRKNFDSIPDEVLVDLIKNRKTTLKRLSEKYGINYTYVTKRYKNIGVESRYQRTLKLEIVETDLRKMVDQGFNIDQIAYKYQVSPNKIIKAMESFGIERKPPVNKLKFDAIFSDSEQVNQIRQYAAEGMTVTEIARIYRVPMTTLYSKMKQLGIKTSKDYKIAKINDRIPSVDEVLANIQSGITVREMAQSYNVSISKLYKFMKEHGIQNLKQFQRAEKMRKLPPREQIITDILSGQTIEKLAVKYDLPEKSLVTLLERMGLKPRELRKQYKNK